MHFDIWIYLSIYHKIRLYHQMVDLGLYLDASLANDWLILTPCKLFYVYRFGNPVHFIILFTFYLIFCRELFLKKHRIPNQVQPLPVKEDKEGVLHTS